MRYILLLIPAFCLADSLPHAWLTQFELSQGTASPTHAECVDFCKRLAAEAEDLEYSSIGTSPEGREIPLLLLGGDEAGAKPLVFIVAGIHSGEIDGKDAGLLYFRDMIIGDKYKRARESLRIAFCPIFNVDGHERSSEFNRINQVGPEKQGWRTTAQNLNLNRDWLKADAPEMRAMIAEIDRLKPEFLMDIHVTDGAEYEYVVTWALGTFDNEVPAVRGFSRDMFLPNVAKRMKKRDYDFVPYVIFKADSPESGWVREAYPPRFSTGYGSLIGRPFLLIETHSRKPFAERVEATRVFLEESLEWLASNTTALLTMSREADEQLFTLADSLRLTKQPYPLALEQTSDSVIVDYKGCVSKQKYSEIAGDTIRYWTKAPEKVKIPFFEECEISAGAIPPLAYVIPAPYFVLIKDVIGAHGIPYLTFESSGRLEVETFQLDSVTFADAPFEGRFRADFRIAETLLQSWEIPKGSALLPLNHERVLRVMHLLEPNGPDSFVRWGFLSQIFEQKEYFDFDIMDTIATRLMNGDSLLAQEFWTRTEYDTAFANSPRSRLQFWFEHSPYWDTRKDLYPIGRIVEAMEFQRAAQSCGLKL